MLKWIKSLFSNTHEDRIVEYFREINKPDISEPVYAILKAWKEDPKRFSFSTDFKYFDPIYATSLEDGIKIRFYDKILKESIEFLVRLERYAVIKDASVFFKDSPFSSHKLYVAFGYDILLSPSWITQDEVDYLEKSIVPYYFKRCERYAELIEYRKDRQRCELEKRAQLTKEKERKRLMELYK